MELIKKTIRVGNSAGVLLPKKLLGAEVRVIVIKRPKNYKKLGIKILAPYLEDIEAACITSISPFEILAISKTKRILKNSSIKISFVPKEIFIKDFNTSSVLKEKINKAIKLVNSNFFKLD